MFFGSLFGLFVLILIGVLLGNRDIAPPDFSDLEPRRTPVPEHENAYPLLVESDLLLVEDDQDLLEDFRTGDPYEKDDLEAFFTANGPAVNLLREAAGRSGFWYEFDYSFSTVIEGVSGAITLAQVMCAQSEWEYRNGNVQEAVALVSAVNRLGALIGSDGASLIYHLVGVAVGELGMQQTRNLIRSGTLAEEQLQVLATSLRGGEGIRHGAEEAIRSEFTAIKGLMMGLKDPSNSTLFLNLDSFILIAPKIPLIGGYVYHPNESLRFLAEELRTELEGLDTPWNQVAERDMYKRLEPWVHPSPVAYYLGTNFIGRRILMMLIPSSSSAVERMYVHLASRRATRLLIAVRLFELREGRVPDKLKALVPTYLSEVPVDPFSGTSFQYDSARKVLWSIGTDRVNQNGSTLSGGARPASDATRSQDQVYSLGKTFDELVQEQARE